MKLAFAQGSNSPRLLQAICQMSYLILHIYSDKKVQNLLSERRLIKGS